jgi:(2Fe-2S) ferredoxin
MEKGSPPYDTLILVCTNARKPGERVSCAGEGFCGARLRDALKDEAAKRGLKGRVRVSASGCLDLCEEGPNVLVFDGVKRSLYKKVSEADLSDLIQSHLPLS